jgi:AcrR family transcriptional regulator
MPTDEPDVKMRLLHAAKRLFAKQGYEGTSVRQICEEAGANIALVSYYFGGKENIFQALIENFVPIRDIEELTVRELTPVEGVRGIIRGVTYFRLREPDMIQILQQEILFNSARIEVIRKFAFPMWIRLREYLREGRDQGHFRFRSLNNTLLTVLGAVMFHKQTAYFLPLLEPEEVNVEGLIEDLNEFVFSGLHYTADKNG